MPEKQSLDNHLRYRALFENMSSGAAVYKAIDDGRDFLFVDFNHTAEKIEGVSRDKILGKPVSEVFPGIIDFGLLDVFRRVWKTGTAEHFPIASYKDQKISSWRENYVYQLSTGEIVAIYRDVTAQMQTKQALHNSQFELRLQNMVISQFLTLQDDTIYQKILEIILTSLKCSYGFFGYINEDNDFVCPTLSQEIWEKCKITDKTMAFPRDSWGGLWGEAMKEQKTVFRNTGLQVPPGHIPLQNGLAVPITHNDQLIGVICVSNREQGFCQKEAGLLERICHFIAPILGPRLQTQILEKQNLQTSLQLKHSEEQLRHSQKIEAIGTLAGGIAHDFNNILSVIIGYAEMAKDTIPPNSVAASDINNILTAGHRAKDLVKHILAFSRQEEQHFEIIEIQPLILEELKLLRSSLPASIEIQHELTNNCGTVRADANQLQQVIMNLCVNAKQAMAKDGGILYLSLKPRKIEQNDTFSLPELTTGDWLEITISDTGPGIEKAALSRIFDPFFTTKEPGEGTGLGLSMVHGIIESHGGTIKVNSRIGLGTTFHIFLPVCLDKKQQLSINLETIPGGSEHILIVDDEPLIIAITTRILEKKGYQITSFNSSTKAFRFFMKHPDKFDLMITDMTMPDMSGKELSSLILEKRPDFPIILCTGFTEIIDEKEAVSMGIRAYFTKPVDGNKLTMGIRGILDGKNPGH